MTRRAAPTRRLSRAGRASGPGARGTRRVAAPAVPVTLSPQLAGGFLTVTATTPLRGTTYHDCWSISPSLALSSATLVVTSPPRRPRYVSEAVVAASSLAEDTTYTFSYAIVMRAGERAWVGSRSVTVTVTVGADGSVPEIPAGSPRPRP